MMTYYKKCRIYGVVSVAFSVLFAFSEFAVAEPLSVFNGKTVVGVQQTQQEPLSAPQSWKKAQITEL